MSKKTNFFKAIVTVIVISALGGCATTSVNNRNNRQPIAETEIIDFKSLSREEVKLAFLAAAYSQAKAPNEKKFIAGLVYPDLGREADARQKAKMQLGTLDADINAEFEKRLGQALSKYSGKVFRSRIQDSGAIPADMTGFRKTGLGIRTEVMPHSYLQQNFNPIGIGSSRRYSGYLTAVGGSQSEKSINFPPMDVSIVLPVSEAKLKTIVYEAVTC